MNKANADGIQAALTIAGSDSGAGAGIQADLLTFASMGVYGTTAITCLTAQNPSGVINVQPASPELVKDQIRQVLDYFPVRALKTGMLFDSEIIRIVSEQIRQNSGIQVVVDPVMVATSGDALLKADAVNAMVHELCPLATIITPNLDEAAVMLDERPDSVESMRDAAIMLARKTGGLVLIKGGHLGSDVLTDVLADKQQILKEYTADKLKGIDSHGSGCTLSAAITAGLARGLSVVDSISLAHAYLQEGLRNPIHIKEVSEANAKMKFINHGSIK